MQVTESQTAPGEGVLCMECALCHHDYREMLQHETGVSETPFPQAWIDGRRHMLLSRAWAHHETCTECNKKAPLLYVRMK